MARSADDLVCSSEREAISRLIEKVICPHLARWGEYFYYCSGGIPCDVEFEDFQSNPILQAKVNVATMDLYCMGTPERCACYDRREFLFPGEPFVKRR